MQVGILLDQNVRFPARNHFASHLQMAVLRICRMRRNMIPFRSSLTLILLGFPYRLAPSRSSVFPRDVHSCLIFISTSPLDNITSKVEVHICPRAPRKAQGWCSWLREEVGLLHEWQVNLGGTRTRLFGEGLDEPE